MSNEVALHRAGVPAAISAEKMQLLKQVLNIKCSDAMLAFFGEVCSRVGLDPFRKQIYLVVRKDRWGNDVPAIQTGIDGFRAQAARTGEYAGQDLPVHDREDAEHPTWARVTVYRFQHGQRIAYTALARWSEYCQRDRDGRPSGLWKNMPYAMLDKCAEALAIRKGFPETSGMELEGTARDDEGPELADAPAAAGGAAALNAKVAQLGAAPAATSIREPGLAEKLKQGPVAVHAPAQAAPKHDWNDDAPPPLGSPASVAAAVEKAREVMPPPFVPPEHPATPPKERTAISPPERSLPQRWSAGVKAFAGIGTSEEELRELIAFPMGSPITEEVLKKAAELYDYMAKQPQRAAFDNKGD